MVTQPTHRAVDVLLNDLDLDGDLVSVSDVAEPENGVAVHNAGGTVTYTPSPGFFGLDAFFYSITDGNGGTDTAVVTVRTTETPDTEGPTLTFLSPGDDTFVFESLVLSQSDFTATPGNEEVPIDETTTAT